MGVEEILARHIVNTKYEHIPAEAIRASKKDILDTLGTALAGSAAVGSKKVVELVKEWGGKRESTVFVYGDKLPAHNVALANSTLANAVEYNDWHDGALVHAGISVVPASFAIAERKGKVTGKELITAVTLGLDLICRMGLSTSSGMRGWNLSTVYGFFAAAAVASRILGFDQDGVLNALGIAYSQAAGNTQCIRDGALVEPGFAAKGGIVAALLAEKGYTGIKNSLEGVAGLFNVYHWGEYDVTPLIDKLGEVFEGVNLHFKPWPCCRGTHTNIEGTLALVQEHDIHPEDVDEIVVFIPRRLDSGMAPHVLCYPLEIKRNPRNIVDALWNIPYAVSTAIAKRRVTLDDFTNEAIKDPVVLQLTQKVTPRLAPELERRGSMHPGVVEIRTKKGNVVYTKRVDFAYGSPENPMTMEALSEKFRDCASHSAKPLSRENVETAIEMLSSLEDVDNVSEIVRLLA